MIITNETEQREFEKHLLKVYSKRTSDLSDSLTRPYEALDPTVQSKLAEILNLHDNERYLLARFDSSNNFVVISNQRLIWAIDTSKINALAWNEIKSITMGTAEQNKIAKKSESRHSREIERLNWDSIEIIEKSAKIHVIDFESGPQLDSIHWCLTALHNSFHLEQKAQDNPEAYIAHKFSSNHREQILQSKLCGCFFCLSIFTPSSIERWIDRDKTALCPNCHIDAVIGSKSGLAVTENLLKRMKRLWFDSGR